MSSYQLVTQNLVVSAAQHELTGHPVKSNVVDLASLIDLIAVYEGLMVLGDEKEWRKLTEKSKLIKFLIDTRILRCAALSQFQAATLVSKRHLDLIANLAGKRDQEWHEFVTSSFDRQLRIQSDGLPEIDFAQEWLATAPQNRTLAELMERDVGVTDQLKFFGRTFLYLGFMDRHNIGFTPDFGRVKLVSRISELEQTAENDFLTQLQTIFNVGLSMGAPTLSSWLSPFAAYVFENAKGDPYLIPSKIAELRDQLSGFRRRLHSLADRMRWGPRIPFLDRGFAVLDLRGQENSTSYMAAIKARQEYYQGIQELLKYGEPEATVDYQPIVGLGAAATAATLKPTPDAWAKVVGQIPLDKLIKLFRRPKFVEIHHVFRALSAPGRLRVAVEKLFGQEILHR
jgi:hypothetical protein